MRERAPAFQFYPKDFLSDGKVLAMSLAEVGAYIKLLCFCWTEGSLPIEPTALARMVGTSEKQFIRLWPALMPCFTLSEGRYRQGRIERERAKQDERREVERLRGKAGADARWHKQQPGMPEASNTHASSNAQALLGDSSSSSSSTAKEQIQDPAIFDRWFDRFWSAYPSGIRGKGSKKPARLSFLRAAKREPNVGFIERVMSALSRQEAGMLRDGGKFVPHAVTWLNQERWNDELPAMKADTGEFVGWTCPHTPHCAHRTACRITSWKANGGDPAQVGQIA